MFFCKPNQNVNDASVLFLEDMQNENIGFELEVLVHVLRGVSSLSSQLDTGSFRSLFKKNQFSKPITH